MLLLPDRDLGDGDPVRLVQRPLEQVERLAADRLGLQHVAAFEVDRVDLRQVDEPRYLDGVLGRHRQVGEVGGLHHDVLLLGVLVAAHDLGALHLPLVVGAPAPLPDPVVAARVQGHERDVLAIGRRVQPDGNDHHSEADGASPYGPWHDALPPRGPAPTRPPPAGAEDRAWRRRCPTRGRRPPRPDRGRCLS